MRDDGCRGVAVIFSDLCLYAIGSKYTDSRQLCRVGEGVGVHTHKECACDVVGFSVVAYCLSDRKDMIFIETSFFRATSMS